MILLCECAKIFLSTPSARRATVAQGYYRRGYSISIHALREEGDNSKARSRGQQRHFYPRPPRGGRRGVAIPCRLILFISIHALREEGDSTASTTGLITWHFYPRPPRGGRHRDFKERGGGKGFLSTPSARRATGELYPCKPDIFDFYPRPPRGGRPPCAQTAQQTETHFYPRPPRGGRP